MDQYPNERKARRALATAYPDMDEDEIDNLAYLVSQRRLTIDTAKKMLSQKMEQKVQAQSQPRSPTPNPEPQSPVATAAPAASMGAEEVDVKQSEVEEVKEEPVVPAPRSAPVKPATTATATATTSREAPRQSRSGGPVAKAASNINDNGTKLENDPDGNLDPSLIHYYYGDNAVNFEKEVIGKGGQVILFTTSMTSETIVRSHTRRLQNLLDIRRVPYHYMDVADNIYLQSLYKLLYKMTTKSTKYPDLPLLFVDRTFVGTYNRVQELEEENLFIAELAHYGYQPTPENYRKLRVFVEDNYDCSNTEPAAESPPVSRPKEDVEEVELEEAAPEPKPKPEPQPTPEASLPRSMVRMSTSPSVAPALPAPAPPVNVQRRLSRQPEDTPAPPAPAPAAETKAPLQGQYMRRSNGPSPSTARDTSPSPTPATRSRAPTVTASPTTVNTSDNSDTSKAPALRGNYMLNKSAPARAAAAA